uniref:BHLH domain-containing protein n=1 Tax=Oryza punctata TaxID=4537 RepID=A0A0E0JPD1_ORYPU
MEDDDVDHPFYFAHDAATGVDVVDDEELLASLGFLLPPPLATVQSAFAAYQSSMTESDLSRRFRSSPANVHRRMHEYLRSIDDGAGGAGVTVEMQVEADERAVEQQQVAPIGSGGGSARFRHIMRERLRRERLSQGYADLQAILPTGASSSKVVMIHQKFKITPALINYGGKNYIVGAAASYIRELEGRKGWLRARNEEMERTTPKPGAGMVVKVRAETEFGSTLDVFEAVLRRLKAMDELQVTVIQSCFGAGGMWMDVAVESKAKVSSREVDKAITNALEELQEIKSSCLQDPISSGMSFSCQVESGVLLMS